MQRAVLTDTVTFTRVRSAIACITLLFCGCSSSHHIARTLSVRLLSPIQFVSSTVTTNNITRAEATRLMREKVKLAGDAAKGMMLASFSRTGKLVKFHSDATTLQFETSTRSYHLSELARGDYNHDGAKDSLVWVSWHSIEASGRGADTLLIQRLPGQPLTMMPFHLP